MPGGQARAARQRPLTGQVPHGRFAKISSACYLLAPVCEVVSLVAFALFVAVCSVGATCVPAPVLMPLGLVLFAVTLAQELSYCEGAPAALYAVPPLPPLGLFMPGSLCVEPGDVAELPGVSWAAFALGGYRTRTCCWGRPCWRMRAPRLSPRRPPCSLLKAVCASSLPSGSGCVEGRTPPGTRCRRASGSMTCRASLITEPKPILLCETNFQHLSRL